jgi:hypothetical protein
MQVRETRRMCEIEVQTVKHRAALALTAKNHEIHQFQIKLEGILHASTDWLCAGGTETPMQ